jgi:CRISPR-associated protein Csx17
LEALDYADEDPLFLFRTGVSSGDVAAWLDGPLDETRLSSLTVGLAHAHIPEHLASQGGTTRLPAAYNVLKPFFVPDSMLIRFNLLPPNRQLPLPGELMSLLQTGRVQDAVAMAWQRLRAVGFPLPPHPRKAPSVQGLDGPCLLATLAVPLEYAELARCLAAVTRKPSAETA